MDNLARAKMLSKEWEKKQKVVYQNELRGVESKIEDMYSTLKEGIFSVEEVDTLK